MTSNNSNTTVYHAEDGGHPGTIGEDNSVRGKLFQFQHDQNICLLSYDSSEDVWRDQNLFSQNEDIVLATGRWVDWAEQGETVDIEYEIILGETVGWLPAIYLTLVKKPQE